MEAVRKASMRAAAPVGLIGSIGGFVADVVAPLGNFAPWIMALSLAIALAALFGFLKLRRQQGDRAWETPIAAVLVIAGASTIIFGGWSVVFAAGPERGYLAENIEPIAEIQARLLNIEQEVGEIKETTGETATQVVVAATAQAQGFADIQQAFAELQRGEGTIIANPATPQEWYSNARLYQLRGDTANAIRAYEGYLSFNLEFVDPLKEYSALLRASEGIARTRQIIGDLLNRNPQNLSLELMIATLLDTPQERLERLNALATRAPQYGPVFAALGEEYTRAIGTTATQDILNRQTEAFETLVRLEEQQLFSRYYIDKLQADQQLDTARRSLAAFAGAQTVFGTIDIDIAQYSNGTQFTFIFAEASTAQDILFSIDNPDPQTSTGRSPTGMPNILIAPMLLPVGDHTIYMRYIDANGVESAVYSEAFTVNEISVLFIQLPPDFSTNTIPATFTVGILGAKLEDATFYTYRYSIDEPSLSETKEGFAIEVLQITGLTPGEHTLYIQADGSDGSQTAVVEYPFVVN
ncbi:MAG TPA: hypothetical protein PKA05_18735 [Roseiflexaceae bacterium]|nr:hypothetical protein [Roseiflexaceae bacterium]HMP42422.1 hypothetical protein [Roseiflexaceae bacterium]